MSLPSSQIQSQPSHSHSQYNPPPPPPGNLIESLERPPNLVNHHSPAFNVLCRFFEQLRDHPGKRRDLLGKMFELLREYAGPDLYPFIRLLLPDRDRERPVFGLKEAQLAKIYVKLFNLDRHSDAAQRLIHWKVPRLGSEATGDFPQIAYEAIKARQVPPREDEQWTVDAVNMALNELASTRKGDQQQKIFDHVYRHLTAEQQRWFIRIILKDLKISVRERTVLNVFHPDAQELFNVSSDLKRVCWTLADRTKKLATGEAEIKLFRSFLPQLCKRTANHDLAAIVRPLPVPFFIEEKMDGERLQMHKKRNEWRWFSRKAKDYTYLYGGHLGEGSLVPHIYQAFNDKVESCILDGECLVFDPLLNKYLPFGTLKSAALDRSNQPDAPRPCFKVFDILMLNDVSFVGKSLRRRKEALAKVFEPVPGRLELADTWQARSVEDVQEKLEYVVGVKGEGLVVKDPRTPYIMNGRTAEWTKIKPEYADDMGELLDLTVLGGWWGGGKRGGRISSLWIAVRDQQNQEGDELPTFTTLGKVGGGLALSDYMWIEEKLGPHWIEFPKENPPDWILRGPGRDDVPDVMLNRDRAFIITVKASEINESTDTGCRLALRFPRVLYIRREESEGDEDNERRGAPQNQGEKKDWGLWDGLSMDELRDLDNQRHEQRYRQASQVVAKKKRKLNNGKRKAGIASPFVGQALSGVSKQNNIFKDCVFHVFESTASSKSTLPSKTDLERLIVENGGDFAQLRTPGNMAIPVGSKKTHNAAKKYETQDVTIVRPEWILESIKRGRMLPMTEELTLYADEESKSSPYYHFSLADLDSAIKSDDDITEDEEAEEEELRDYRDHNLENDQKPDLKHKAPYRQQSPTRDLDLGGGIWQLRDVRENAGAGEGDGSETEPESDLEKLKEEDDDEVSGSGEGRFAGGRGNGSVLSSEERETPPPDRFQPDSLPLAAGPSDRHPPPAASPNDEHPIANTTPAEVPLSPKVKMGETDEDMEYDDEKIFKHLVFYLDRAELSRQNGLTEKKGKAASDNADFDDLQTLITSNGGKIADNMHAEKLTHIIQGSGGGGRYKELRKVSSRPVAKQIVIPDFVRDSLAAGRLQLEDAYRPD